MNINTNLSLDEAVILIVDDEPINATVIESLLSPYKTQIVDCGKKVLSMCDKFKPDLILLDVVLGDMSGLEVCKTLKTHPLYSHIPVIFITAILDQEDQNKCWQAGGIDFVPKPVYGATLLNRVKVHLTLKKQTDLLKCLSQRDSLTGLYNRRYLQEALKQNIRLAKRNNSALSVLMIDIDWFKQYNDLFGHQQGDLCLKQVANEIQNSLNRPTDTVIRYGGEEFLCVLPDTDMQGATFITKKLLSNICKLNIEHPKASAKIISVSIGCTTLIDHHLELNSDSLIRCADTALYQAKNQGRNRCVCLPAKPCTIA
ncbi:diguanylate cyclase [Pseudoalteromonas sp. CO302Y]|uniref:GGDEF domain-containing response regulator n=1 Tax=unclassified Pseudoalteromonas TaxID=194690 RepID=UPI001022EE6B|nr:diguanylate cyclase [Pseudoalteromonas sp. CO302Y]RZG06010.1 diguanylate cyclase [Pseudoalteromonas sp. CO133X]